MSLVGDIGEVIVRGAVAKAVQGFVAKGEITPAQGSALVAGVMVELQLALEIYENAHAPGS
ncbi:MAG TPA: hypothetical protein VKU90_08200 [Caulobacteraceae bacterium]|nr:hypothetical protein [Caulobacteraceae bacterium]